MANSLEMEPSERIPAAPLDLVVHSWQAIGAGELIAEMELEFDRSLDVDLLASASDRLLEVEPILGCRLVVDSPVPYWQRLPPGGWTPLMVIDDPECYARVRHSGLDATKGAPIVLCLLRRESGDRLLIKIAHQVGDGGGLHLIAARLSEIYSALAENRRYRPTPSHAATRDVMQLLPRVPWRAIVWDFVRFMAPRTFPRRTCQLPPPYESSGEWCFVERRLSESQVAFLSAYGRQRGATLNDLFLAATYRVLASRGKWDGTSALRVLMTVDLRRYLPNGRADHVCNLSTMDCPYLGRELGDRFEDTVANVRALTNRRKENWPGLAVVWLTYLGLKLEGYHKRVHTAGKRGKRAGFPKITLSNTGPIDKARVTFAGRSPVSACILPSFRKLPGLLICLSGYDGTLRLSAGTSQNAEAMVGDFFDTLIAELPTA